MQVEAVFVVVVLQILHYLVDLLGFLEPDDPDRVEQTLCTHTRARKLHTHGKRGRNYCGVLRGKRVEDGSSDLPVPLEDAEAYMRVRMHAAIADEYPGTGTQPGTSV
jgi:hypothetical protein